MLQRQVKCQYCRNLARLTDGNEVWPRHPELAERKVWVCDRCKARVTCQDGTDIPLGDLADGFLRKVRIEGHAAFDPIVRITSTRSTDSYNAARTKIYAWLARELGIPVEQCHFAKMDYDTAIKATTKCQSMLKYLVDKFGTIEHAPPVDPPDYLDDVPF